MSIEFSTERWQLVKDNSRKWWAHELDRPLIQIRVGGYEAKRPKPEIPWHHFTSFYDTSVPAAKIVDWWEYNLQSSRFLGDAFPHVMPYFGAGVAAAFMGADLFNGAEGKTTWFRPKRIKAARDLSLRHDPADPWWPRVREICKAAGERFGGLVQIGMTDLGGCLDLVSTFRPGENLLLDLYDSPDQVKRLAWEAHDCWWDYFGQLDALCGPQNPGYSCWTSIYSQTPYYMLQCDFSYMIGPDMFDEFVKPELAASCRRLANAFYHLDGPGQLPHLDSLLSIPELRGIQWVSGAGQPEITEWPDVYRRIHKAGKLIQIFQRQSKAGMKALDIIADQIGTTKGIIMLGDVGRRGEEAAMKFLERHRAV